MDFLKSVMACAEAIDEAAFDAEIDALIAEGVAKAAALIKDLQEGTDEAAAKEYATVLARDIAKFISEQAEADDGEVAAGLNLVEAATAEYVADVAKLSELDDVVLVGAHDTIVESFESAVQKVLKNDKKLKANSSGKYKTREKAADAIVASSLRKAGCL